MTLSPVIRIPSKQQPTIKKAYFRCYYHTKRRLDRSKAIILLSHPALVVLIAGLQLCLNIRFCCAFQLWPLLNNNNNNNNSINPLPETNLVTSTNPPEIYTIAKARPSLDSCIADSTRIMKAWTCHGNTQKELVDRLIQARIIQSRDVQSVMYQVDRKYYVPSILQDLSYQDSPQPIELGQTISAPHMHAHALEEILPYLVRRRNQLLLSKDTTTSIRILDVGCGSGYLTACFGRWFQPRRTLQSPPQPTSVDDHQQLFEKVGIKGTVYGIDIHSRLVDLTKQNIQKNDSDLLESGTVQLQVSNGWGGLRDEAPFDAIHVGAAASTFPIQLAQQLRVGGVLIVPIGPVGATQSLYKAERISARRDSDTDPSSSLLYFDPNEYKVIELLGVRYVPLIDGPSTNPTPSSNTNSGNNNNPLAP